MQRGIDCLRDGVRYLGGKIESVKMRYLAILNQYDTNSSIDGKA